jgi:hypothetical protein
VTGVGAALTAVALVLNKLVKPRAAALASGGTGV